MGNELKPCQFCGSDKADVGLIRRGDGADLTVYVTCFACLCRGPVSWEAVSRSAEEGAIAMWNQWGEGEQDGK
jgi:hypothetical protein